jgi:hypothetical protein
MTIKLLDYQDKETLVDVGELDTIGYMEIEVVTGDEILTVVYKDFTSRRFDSASDRMMNFNDGRYEIYNTTKAKNALFDPRFIDRKTSYEYMYGDEEDEEDDLGET